MNVTFYTGRFPKPKDGQILITHSIKPKEVKFLINKKYGNKIFSNDKGSKNYQDTKEKINKLYDDLNIKKSDSFASLVVRTSFSNGLITDAYGSITLVLKKDKINKDTIVFNGDVQDLAFSCRDHSFIKTYKLDAINLLNELETLKGSVQYPKLMSSYFEARLFREIRIDDIEDIYAKKEDIEACSIAKELVNYINYKQFQESIESTRKKQNEIQAEIVRHFTEFFSNFKFDIAMDKNSASSCTKIGLFHIENHLDIDKLTYGVGFYIIFTDCKFEENRCKLTIGNNLKAIYRGHGTRLKKRLESHLFNKKYNDNRSRTNYDVCMKIEEGVSGINIDEGAYQQYNWYVFQWKMENSTKFEREQTENAFDLVFGRPLACREIKSQKE